MFKAFAQSRQLVKESWAVLNTDRELVWFPIFSALGATLLMLLFAIPSYFLFMGDVQALESFQMQPIHYIILFLYYVLSYFIVFFFQTALVASAYHRFTEGDPTVQYGLAHAVKHTGRIFVWAVIASTVGMILNAIANNDRSRILGNIVALVLGAAWNLLTIFMVPILVLEEKSLSDSLKQSANLFRKTWGENAIGQISIGGFLFVFAILGFVPLVFGLTSGGVVGVFGGIAFTVIYWIVLSIVGSALSGIFLTALYMYARTGKAPSAFSAELITEAYKKK